MKVEYSFDNILFKILLKNIFKFKLKNNKKSFNQLNYFSLFLLKEKDKKFKNFVIIVIK